MTPRWPTSPRTTDARRAMRTLALLLLLTASVRADQVWLGDSLARLGFPNPDPAREGRETYERRGNPATLVAERDREHVLIDGIKVHLDSRIRASTYRVTGKPDAIRLTVERADYLAAISPIIWGPPPGSRRPMRIVLDPGHGGKDPGKQNLQLKVDEKTMTLDVARRLATLLRRSGHEVLLTRDGDTFVELKDRAAFANRAKADLFISIHFNADDSAQANGTETYCLTPAGQQSTNTTSGKGAARALAGNRHDALNALLAFETQRMLVRNLGGADRGVRRARFAVLTDLNCPGVLVETAFLSNPAEARKVASESFRQAIAQNLAAAVTNYEARMGR